MAAHQSNAKFLLKQPWAALQYFLNLEPGGKYPRAQIDLE